MRNQILSCVREHKLPMFSIGSRLPTRRSLICKSDVNSTSLTFIKSPAQFHRLLCLLTKQAKHRIAWSSLYLGTDEKTRELCDLVQLQNGRESQLSTSLVLDYNRSSRDLHSDACPLRRLAAMPRTRVSLFQSPLQRQGIGGLLARIPGLPPFVREIVSVQHTKVYLFDNNVVLSGANLSRDYFTNRQDRYLFIRNHAPLADFYDEFLTLLADYSSPLVVSADQPRPSPLDEQTRASNSAVVSAPTVSLQAPARLVRNARQFGRELLQFLHSRHGSSRNYFHGADATLLVPLFQFGAAAVHAESRVVSQLVESIPSGQYSLSMASAYFNPPRALLHSLLANPSRLELVVAAPAANGFHAAPGLTGWLPYVYVLYETAVFRLFRRQYRQMSLLEFARPAGWTFHAKGLWCFRPKSRASNCWTVVGSSNFGARSAQRDLEASLLVHTVDRQLKRQLQREKEELVVQCRPVQLDEHRGYADQSLIGRFLIRLTSILFKQVL